MFESIWIKLGAGAALALLFAVCGYKIGTWKESSAQAKALQQCRDDLGKQRETDLSSANHALAEALQKASSLAHSDAVALGDLAKEAQTNARAFAADTEALYASVVGGCTVGPDLVRVLREASDQANRDIVIGQAASVAGGGHAAGSTVPRAAGKSGPAPQQGAGANPWRGVDSGSRSVQVGSQ